MDEELEEDRLETVSVKPEYNKAIDDMVLDFRGRVELPSRKPDWETLKDKPLDTIVVSNLQLSPCTMDEFFSMFLADTASHSLSHFLQSRGDSELEATPWNATDERVVRYMHPVNAPLAPPTARARKEQNYDRYGKNLVIHTRTVVDDVPMTDCFYVSDRIMVEPGVKEDGTCYVSVRMEFEITFVKSTMFQGLIRKTTSGEFDDFFEELAQFMQNAVDGGGSSPSSNSSTPNISTSKKNTAHFQESEKQLRIG